MNPFETKSVTFAEPIEMLYALSWQSAPFLQQVAMLSDYIAENGCNQIVLQTIRQIAQYFNVAAPLHHKTKKKISSRFYCNMRRKLKKALTSCCANISACTTTGRRYLPNSPNSEADNAYVPDAEAFKRFVAGYDVHLAIEEPAV